MSSGDRRSFLLLHLVYFSTQLLYHSACGFYLVYFHLSAEVLTVLIHSSLQFSENLSDHFLNSSSGKLVISISYSFFQDAPPCFFILLDSLC